MKASGLLFLSLFLTATHGQPFHSSTNLFTGGARLIFKCLNLSEMYDRHLGRLSLDPQVYCTKATFRTIRGLTCCTPQNTSSIGLTFYLYTPGRRKPQQVFFWKKNDRKKFSNFQKDLVFLIPGFLETIRDSPWMNETKDGFNSLGHPVIQVGWGEANQIQYWQSIADVRTVGAAIGHAIVKWRIINRVLLTGLSLGSQIIGEAGKFVREKTGRLVKECHALEPSGTFFDGGSNELVLDRGDCRVLQVIHTSAPQTLPTSTAEFIYQRLSTALKRGHCDWWINCGHFQEPECLNPNLQEFVTALALFAKTGEDGPILGRTVQELVCSHVRPSILYRNFVTNRCNYQSYRCVDCGMGPQGDFCSATGPVVNSLPPFSRCNPSMNVSYYMKTTGSGNYCSLNPYLRT